MADNMVLCLFLLFSFTGIANSVPHDFCFDAFDGRDCGRAPVPVFYYYKPGSRCEIREWRGCETRNRFPDQVVCNSYCIWLSNSTAAVDELPPEPEPEITSQEESVNEQKGLKLEIKEGLADVLPPEPEPEITQEEFVNELKELRLEVMEGIADILEDIINTPILIETTMTEEPELGEERGKTTTEAQTEAGTEAQTMAETEAETQAETEAQPEVETEAQTEAVTEAATEAKNDIESSQTATDEFNGDAEEVEVP